MSIPIRLFQVGDVVLRLFEQNWHGYPVQFTVQPKRMLWSERFGWPEAQYRPNPKQITINGILLGENKHTKDMKINRLNQLAGSYIDVIAYTFNSCCPDYDCGCSCKNRWSSKDLLWLHTRGAITAVNARPESSGNFPFSITLSLDAAWQPLNRFIWEFWNGYSIFAIHAVPSPIDPLQMIRPYPNMDFIENLCDNTKHWHKRKWDDDNIMYNPELWDDIHEHHRLTFDYETGIGSDFISYSTPHTTIVNSNVNMWSTRPSSLYAFTAIPILDQIVIEVMQAVSPFESEIQTSTLDVAALSTAMGTGGYIQLFSTDIIYAGNTVQRPGFILRPTTSPATIIDDITIPWEYPGEYPGQLNTRTNRVRVTLPLNPPSPNPDHAYLHTYRRL